MDKRIIVAILMLASGAAGAERGRTAKPDSSRHKPPMVDLDLTLGLEEEPAAMQGDPSQPRTTWYYWAAAGAALTAGGVGLYWYDDRAKTANKTIRKEQVFTDEQ